MKKSLRAGLLAIGVGALVVVPAAGATAAPTQAPHQLVGTANCGSLGTFTFVVTQNNGQGSTWNPAFITAADGSTALFIPSSLDLTFTSPEGTFTQQSTKGATSGPVSCEISASPGQGFMLSGTVTGTIIWTG